MAETNEKLIADLELAYQYALDLILGTDPATAKGIREATADLQKARAAVLARMCGPGEVVVPREPTEEMEEAGWIDKEDVCPCDIYRAMLAARPKNGGNDDQGK